MAGRESVRVDRYRSPTSGAYLAIFGDESQTGGLSDGKKHHISGQDMLAVWDGL